MFKNNFFLASILRLTKPTGFYLFYVFLGVEGGGEGTELLALLVTNQNGNRLVGCLRLIE